jgi:hypothetical protein
VRCEVEIEIEMFHWGFGVHGLRFKVEVEACPHLSYPASIKIVIETKHGPIAALDMGGSSTQIVFLAGMQPQQQRQQQQDPHIVCSRRDGLAEWTGRNEDVCTYNGFRYSGLLSLESRAC